MSCLGLLLALGLSVAAAPVETPKKPVTDTYHGVTVTDDYRWLEDANDPAVKKWILEQNQVTRTALDANPALPPLKKRLRDLLTAPSASYFGIQVRGGTLFALKTQPPKEQAFLITLTSPDEPDSARVLLDPSELDKTGKTTIDFYSPSRDGKLVAVSLSKNGSEDGTVHLYEVATGKKLDDIVPRVTFPTAGGDVAWNKSGTGFYYTRYPQGTERSREDMNFFQQVYFHQLGTPAARDAYQLGKDLPRIAEISLETSRDGSYVLATVQNGDGGEFEHHLLDCGSGKWTRLTKFTDQASAAVFDADSRAIYLLSRKAAPRGQILRLPVAEPDLAKAVPIVPQSDAVLDGLRFTATKLVPTLVPTPTGLYVVEIDGGPARVRFVPRDGGAGRQVPLNPVSSVNEIVALKGDDVLIHSESFTEPSAWYAYGPGGERPRKTALYRPVPVDFGDIEVVRDFAVSKDGTKVPLNILARKGTKFDGTNPALLNGYGGFGISLSPRYSVDRRVWLENGGVLAIANLRGGGEYGEAWHRAGNLLNKQNVFDDFVACARQLIDRRVTSASKLAIEGGSNGGLLMGAALTQYPGLFRAVVSHVGLYDMLRFEQHPNGVFNVTEYGSVKDPEQFKALHAYSPYHHVKDGTAYPAVFLLTGANDGRVDPMNTRKMAARLQAATSSKRPIYLEVSFDSGHGIGDSLSDAIDRAAEVYAFLFEQLGMKYQGP